MENEEEYLIEGRKNYTDTIKQLKSRISQLPKEETQPTIYLDGKTFIANGSYESILDTYAKMYIMLVKEGFNERDLKYAIKLARKYVNKNIKDEEEK